ncbi:MAG: L-threonylcarbamoyladenylate synthase [Candidatus Hydrogenedentota bacterium]
MEILAPDEAGIARAAEVLRAGEIVAYPTESVYGLAVDPFNEAALERLYAAKSRDASNPVLMIISDHSHLDSLVETISESAQKCIDAFWPGSLSLLFPGKADLSELLVGAHEKICIRQTSHPIAAALSTAFGGAITSTSANRSFEKPASNPGELELDGVSVCIDGGRAESAPSTVYDPDRGVVLREGAISRIDLHKVNH